MIKNIEKENHFKNSKGFTLIELLTVIVVLIIVALITITIVLQIIDKSKKNAFINSVYGVFDAYVYKRADYEFQLEYYMSISELDLTNNILSGIISEKNNVITINATDGSYCAKGTKENLKITKDCGIDVAAPVVTIKDKKQIASIEIEDFGSGIRAYCISDENNVNKCNLKSEENNILMATELNKWYMMDNLESYVVEFKTEIFGDYYFFAQDGFLNKTNGYKFEISSSGIDSKSYSMGENLQFANLNWKVVNDNGDSVTVILDGYYNTGAYGSTATFKNSKAKTVVNTNFVNANPELEKQIELGALVYDIENETYVRIPKYEEVSSKVAYSSSYPFWTMTASSGDYMNISQNDGSFYRNTHAFSTPQAYYSGYTETTNDASYVVGYERTYIYYGVNNTCTNGKKEQLSAHSSQTSVVVETTCGSYRNDYYYSKGNSSTSISKNGSATITYCDVDLGPTKVKLYGNGTAKKVVYASGTTTNCTKVSEYFPESTTKSIAYRPVITIKKKEESVDIPILADKTYAVGEIVKYARLNWKVISDNGSNVALVLSDNYKGGAYGSTTTWSTSYAKQIVNTDFVNDNVLIKNAIDNGYIVYDSSSTSYVRIPKKSEISTNISSTSYIPFWTMTADGANMYYSLYTGTTNRPKYYRYYTTYYEWYNSGWSSDYSYPELKEYITVDVTTSCGTTTVNTVSLPTSSSVIIDEPCGVVTYDYYSTSAVTWLQASGNSTSFQYCDSNGGILDYGDIYNGAAVKWVRANASSSSCQRRGNYNNIETMYSPIGYRPVITVIKGEK